MSNNKQSSNHIPDVGNKVSSVEWLQWALEHTILTHEQTMQSIGLFEQAKEMHKEEIKEAYWNGSDGIETKTEILKVAENITLIHSNENQNTHPLPN